MPLVQQSRRGATYGKTSRTVNVFEFEPSPPKKQLPLRTAGFKKTLVKELPESVFHTNGPLSAGKLSRPKRSSADEFDIPLSDDEASPTKRTAKKPVWQSGPVKKVKAQPLLEPLVKETRAAPQLRKAATTIAESLKPQGTTTSEKPEDTRKRKREPAPPVQNVAAEQISNQIRPQEHKSQNVKAKPEAQEPTISRLRKRQKTPQPETSAIKVVRKGVSAPAVLSDMLTSLDEDKQLEKIQPPKTPLKSPKARAEQKKVTESITPKQNDLWKSLLQNEQHADDLPEDSHMQETNVNAQKRTTKRPGIMHILKQASTLRDKDLEDEEASSDAEVTHPPQQSQASRPALSRENSHSQPVIQSQRTRMTYGQQRSYRAVEPTKGDNLDALAEQLDQLAQTPAIKKTKSFGNSQTMNDSDEDETSQRAQPKSVFDLRAAGSRRRLLQELEALVNDLGGGGFSKSMSVKRSAMIELTLKLLGDAEVTSCFLEHGLEQRLIKQISPIADVVVNFAAAISLISIMNTKPDLRVLQALQSSDAYAHILKLLDKEQDITQIIKQRATNMSKAGQSSVAEFKTKVLETGIGASDMDKEFLSPRVVAIVFLETMVRRMREAKSQDLLISEETLGKLLKCLYQVVQPEKSKAADILETLVLSILESSSLYQTSQNKRSGWSPEHLKVFAESFDMMLASESTERNARSLALRICVNVTNDIPHACAEFSKDRTVIGMLIMINNAFRSLHNSSSIEAPMSDGERDQTRDCLILSLGALMNLAEHSDDARSASLAEDKAQLRIAVSRFFAWQERAGEADSIEDAEVNVPYGFLAVLLGNLCLNAEVKAEVASQGDIEILVDAINVFIKINQQAGKEDGFEGGEHERLVERMKDVVKALTQ